MPVVLNASEVNTFLDSLRTGPEVVYFLKSPEGELREIAKVKLMDRESIGEAFVYAIDKNPQSLLLTDKIEVAEVRFLGSMLRDGYKIIAMCNSSTSIVLNYNYNLEKFIGESSVLHYFSGG